MQVYKAIALRIAQETEFVFGLLGEEVARLIGTLPGLGIQYISARHEASVAGMADGYARVSGDVGVGIVSRGCGLTNAYTALINASKSQSPVVVFTGDAAVGLEDPSIAISSTWAPKHLNQSGALEAAGVEHVVLASPTTAVADVAEVFAAARSGRTIVVNIPSDVMGAEAGDDDTALTLAASPDPVSPDAARISDVADLLETDWAAHHVVILAGRGAVRSGAGPHLERLGERCGAAYATTLLAKGLFQQSPYNLGIMGTFSSATAIELVHRADVVLAFGAALNQLTTFGGDLPGKAHIIHFDSDPAAFGRYTKPFMAVEGDARLSAIALADELERREHDATGYRTPDVVQQIALDSGSTSYADQSGGGLMDPRTVLTAINDALPDGARVVVDPGHHGAFQATYLRVHDPSQWVWPYDYPAVGSGTPIALGAALADQQRLTVLGIGDGGMMMSLGELETAVRYRIPLLVVLLNDAAFGAEVHFLNLYGMPDETARFPDVSFADIAEAMGAKSATVASAEDLNGLGPLLASWETWSGPLVIDCKITTDVHGDYINSWDRLTAAQPIRGDTN